MKKQITKGCNGAGEASGSAMLALPRPPAEPSRYLKEYLAEEIPFLNRHLAHIDTRKRVVEQMDSLPKGI
ncbi:MAG: hypothetical protein ABL921_35530 [Pirellula sp.]